MPYKLNPDIDSKALAYMASFLLLGRDYLSGSKLKFEKEKHHEQHHQIHTRTWLVVAASILSTSSAEAEIHSRSKQLVVMEAPDLPEQAQIPGNSLFLHSDSAGDTYLYIEQQRGARLSAFDVTDLACIKLVVSTPLAAKGAFDFVRPIGDHAELVYFRDNQKEAVLDLRKTKRHVLRMISTVTDLGPAETLGENGLLVTSQAHKFAPAVARDYQVIDIELATVKDVKHGATNDETGTKFLLGSDGLTVVRRLRVEEEYKVNQMQMEGN